MRKKDALEDFLERHEPIAGSASLATGTILSGWRIVAYLGRGGSAEVYRVVHLSLPLQGALKILIRNEASHIERFRRETELLAKLRHPAFPHFLGSGEVEGRPYIIMELLEPMELPHDDKAVAKFLVSVAEGVKALHSRGIIHRDLKPQNIMRRADGSPVIIDLGLAKRYSPLSRLKMPATLSVVDGKRVGLGTPRYAAPEQFSGGEISPAADIHALGMLADECFGGKAPLCWMRIIRRCSSSIPFLRYQSADDFIRAIKHRHWLRNVIIACAVFTAFVVAAALWVMEPVEVEVEHPAVDEEVVADIPPIMDEGEVSQSIDVHPPVVVEDPELIVWRGLIENMTTNIVELGEVAYEVTNKIGRITSIDKVYRNVTNEIDLMLVRLNGVTNKFERPIHLEEGRECWIVGPGILDAEFLAPTGTIVRLEQCVFLNRTRTPIDVSKIHYKLTDGVYMNFPELDKPESRAIIREYIDDHNSNANKVRFRGPNSMKALREEEERERWYMIRRDMEYPY